jgi:hypothetical protein
MLWPLLPAVGFAIRLTRRFMAALTVPAVVFGEAFLIGYRFSGGMTFRAVFLHPFYFGGFVTSYLSMPFLAE